VISVVFVKG